MWKVRCGDQLTRQNGSGIEHIDHNKDEDLSFFELLTAVAFLAFSKNKADWTILEVGLGGRLDATNIIKPLISIITNIGFDHKKFLGDNLLDIAKEKAGIIKNKIPVIIGQFNKSLNKVFEKAALKANSKIYYANKLNEDYKTDLQGSYQNKNIETALETLSNIPSFTLNKVMMIKGIKNIKKNTNLIARWQIIKNYPKVIFDIAHNIDSLELIFKELENINHKNIEKLIIFYAYQYIVYVHFQHIIDEVFQFFDLYPLSFHSIEKPIQQFFQLQTKL